MSLTPTDIDRLARLSRLQFDTPAAERLLEQLNGFFDIVEQMRAVDTTGVVPMSHPIDTMADLVHHVKDTDELGMTLRLRDDVVSEPQQRDANMHNAPEQAQGLFLVPKVIE